MAARPDRRARVPRALHTRRSARVPRDGGSNVPAPTQPAAVMESLCAPGLVPALPGGATGKGKRPLDPQPSRGAGRRKGYPSSRLYSKVSRRARLPSAPSLLLQPRRRAAAHRSGGLAAQAAMASREASETSFFSLSGVRERMREKKNGALRTAKLNASLASKIKTKIINNSSTIKISLKHNNKALALALNAEKANAQRLTQEKTILQKEVEQCHFQNAVLRHKLSFLNNTLKEFENLMAAVKMARLSEFHTSSASLSNGQKSSMTEDSWADDIADGQLVRAAGMPMRVPISRLRSAGQQGGSSIAVQTSLLDLQRPASKELLEIVPVASKDTLSPRPAEEPQSHQEENGKKPTKAMEAQEAFLDSHIFGEGLCAAEQNPNNLPPLAWESHPLSSEGDEMVKQFFDRLSQGHVTQRRKRSTLFATSTPSSGVDIFPCVSSTQAARWSITKDSSSSSNSNTQQQLKSPSSLVSLTQTTVIPDRKSLGKEIFCDQPQAKETGCGVEVDPNNSQVPEFVPVKVKSKGNCKTREKTTVKKANTGKKKTNAIINNAEGSPDLPQGEESAQNVKKLQPKVATCSSESEASEMRQNACMGAFSRKNRGCGMEQCSCSLDGVQDLRRTYVVNPAQLHSLGSGDSLQQVKKEAVFEIQSMDSLSKSHVRTFSSHEVPLDDSSLQNSLFLRKETSSACALQEDSSVSTKSIRQKTNRKPRVIRERDYSGEENLPNSMKIPEAKAEEQPKRSQTSRKKTVRKNSCSDQRNEVDGFGPCIDIQGVAKESTKDLRGNLKGSRKTYVVCPLDLLGNLGCVQADFEGGEIVPPRCIPGSKASKIPRVQRMVAAQSNKKQTGGLQEKGQAKVDNNMNTLKKEACPKPKPQRKRNTSSPPETDSLASQSDSAKALIGSSVELASKQTVLMGKFSCITDLLSEPDAFLEEQIAEISLTNYLMDVSHSLESSSVTCSAASPGCSRLTDIPVSKSLSTKGNKMPEKSSVWPERSLIFKEKTAEEISGERNQVESSSQSPPSQEPEIRPLQDLTNARTLSSSSLEEVSGCSSRRRRNPACYAEPKLNRKLRQGDPFTDMGFLQSSLYKTKKKTAKAKEMTKKIKKEEEWLPEGCPTAKASKLVTMGKDMEPEVK
ncbi:shugoshin 2 isoform X2 [Grus americana]|uniref:shugoshin 2 isoform X2 n=1 Tax=Grus americana TaxID=9117 RepID=UPI002407911B|nr:shugoshin 2 isoform X2 [Grus americana]